MTSATVAFFMRSSEMHATSASNSVTLDRSPSNTSSVPVRGFVSSMAFLTS